MDPVVFSELDVYWHMATPDRHFFDFEFGVNKIFLQIEKFPIIG